MIHIKDAEDNGGSKNWREYHEPGAQLSMDDGECSGGY